MSRLFEPVRERLINDGGLSGIKFEKAKAGQNILLEQISTRPVIQDGAKDFVDETIRITLERDNTTTLKTDFETIKNLLTIGFITSQGGFHYSRMLTERSLLLAESGRFVKVAFFNIKGELN